MPSVAASGFFAARGRARRLIETALDRRLRPLTYEESEPGLHAGLAALVSAWEAYVESVVLEALGVMYDPSEPRLAMAVDILRTEATRVVAAFNTPNFEKARELLLRFTGFDPINAMVSARLGLGSPQAKNRLDEILRVRHAFAHGAPIPNYSWLKRYGVEKRLTKSAVFDADRLISDFVLNIDRGLATHLRQVFGGARAW